MTNHKPLDPDEVVAALVDEIVSEMAIRQITRGQLAEMTGYKYDRVLDVLKGSSPIQAAMLLRFANALDVHVDELTRRASVRLNRDVRF